MKEFVLTYLLIVNIVGFIIMYIDKKRAINKEWRIKESTLLLVATIGGSLGSLLGMYTFRHKTKHIKFTLGVPSIIFIQIAILIFV